MWQYLLHRVFGIGESPERVSFGSGVVGHTTHVIIALFVAVVAIAYALSEHKYFLLAVVGLLVFLAMFFLLGTWRFADKHPDQAAMGDATWLKFREFQMGMKGKPDLIPLPPESDPTKPCLPTIDMPQISLQDGQESEL